MVDFDSFTTTDPATAAKVASAPNPMIGPNPFDKADTAKPGSAYTVDEAGAMALALADKIVKAIEDGGEDCAKMGGNLKAHIDEAKAAAALDKDFNKDAAKKAEFKKKFDPQLEAKMTGSMPKLQKCATNADVKAFIDSVAAE